MSCAWWLNFAYCLVVLVHYAAGQNVEDQFNRWCQIRNTNDPVVCKQNLKQWCTNSARTSLPLCIYANQGTASQVANQQQQQQAAPQQNTERRPKKANRQQLNQLKDTMNNKGQQQAKQLQDVINLVQFFIKPNPNSRPAQTELDVNKNAFDDYFQGDVDLTENQVTTLIRFFTSLIGQGRKKRKVAQPPNFDLWDKSQFPIPYQFASGIDAATKDIIRQAIKLWESNTCVRWRENGAGTDRIEFQNGDGCSSYVGKSGGTQPISLHIPGCNYVGIASHEIGHSLGFFHEQNRPDQPSYVTINYMNINPFRYNNFLPQSAGDVNYYSSPYDYGSVMHYDGRTSGFTINPNDYAIVAKDKNYQNTMGQRNGPSFIDFKEINMAYCADTCAQKIGCTHDGYEDPNNCAVCKCPSGFGGAKCEEAAPSTPGCGGILTATQNWQQFNTPNYPGNFQKGQECNWIIRATEGYQVSLKFDGTFSFECNDVCSGSFAEVKIGDFQRTGYRFCCNRAPTDVFVSQGNELVIMLRTYGAVGAGFKALYRTNAPDGGDPITTRTAPPQTTTVQGQTRATSPIPNTFAPNTADCSNNCGAWSSWSECDDTCGGCGAQQRQRTCQSADQTQCHNLEKQKCGMDVCAGSPGGIQFRNNKLQLFYQGCCAGLFPSGGRCAGLVDAVGGEITKLFGGIFGNSGKR